MKFELDKCYLIEFLDHSIGDEGVITFQLAGWIIDQGPDHIVINTWNMVNGSDECKQNNLERQNILKSTIKRKRKLNLPF